jgi:hypothetical protein
MPFDLIVENGLPVLAMIAVAIAALAFGIKVVYLEVYRPRKLKTMAARFGLSYTYAEKKRSFPFRRNILEGRLEGKAVSIFDRYELGNMLLSEWTYAVKSTEINIDADSKIRRGFFAGVCPAEEIETVLTNLMHTV